MIDVAGNSGNTVTVSGSWNNLTESRLLPLSGNSPFWPGNCWAST